MTLLRLAPARHHELHEMRTQQPDKPAQEWIPVEDLLQPPTKTQIALGQLVQVRKRLEIHNSQ